MAKMSQNQCQQAASVDHIELNRIKKTFENLVNETQADLKHFMHEQNQLRNQIEDLLVENKHLNTKLEAATTTADATESRDDATREKLTNDVLLNVQKRIDYLEAENNELRSLNKSSRKTIQNLEGEVQNYRNHLFKANSIGEVKQKYDTAIKLLESTIKTQKTEIAKQTQIIENLFEQKKQFNEHIKNLENALQEKERNLNNSNGNVIVGKLQAKLQESTRQSKELEKSLKMSKRVIEERFEREKCALQKVQEALAIAEAAVADKEDAQKREQVVKEECDNLASTIGQVMDEAARKVEKDMEDLRKTFSEKEKHLLDVQEKMKDELQNQKKFNQILETRCNRFQEKYKATLKEVERLTHQLESAAKALEEMECKIKEQERLLKEDKLIKKRIEENEAEIQRYILTNKQLKEKYKAALEDITKKFEREIYRLQSENANLKAENQVIKLQRTMPMMND